jgi:N-acetylated-alpha-linked acidic dipeptidase
VRVHVDNDDGTRPIWVVEGRIRGSERPDELVVLGNHRDAWVYGAVDPSSGTATQLELARVLGAMARDGMRPKRTLVFASWDAEEWHLTGSTEWGEHFADALRAQAVAYLNVDGSTSGPTFEAGTVASLNTLVAQVARDVADPAGGSVLEQWGKAIAGERRDAAIGGGAARDATATDPDDYPGNALGSGSDYTVFLNHLGLPIVEMSFNGPYGVYHSVYDDAYWMEHFGDPGYRYMTTMAEVWGRMALRLANAEVLPVDARRYAERVGAFIDHLAAQPGSDRLAYDGVRAAHEAWAGAARVLEQRLGDLLAMPASPARTERLQRVNDQLRRLEQAFLLPDGIPGRPWFRHALYAPKYTYAAMTLPGVREAADRGDALLAQRQLTLLTQRLAEATAITFRAAEAVRGR